MIAIAVTPTRLQPCEGSLVELFKALSSRFGGAPEDLSESDTQRLVDMARSGDPVARQRLYRQNVDRVYRTVRGMLRSAADAEDVTQDAMLTILTSLDGYSPRSGVRFIAWITTIAVNTARRRFRRRRPELSDTGVLNDVPDEAVDLEQGADTVRKRTMVLKALAKLEHLERDIMSLRYGAELNAAEIAKLVGREPANVRKILERARARMREHLDAAERGEVGR
jgi:RNA polymerase sigma-70 factor (ECF subfamily)